MTTKPELPNNLTTAFGRELVAYLGGDPTKVEDDDCWKDFVRKFPELREAAEKYFEEATTGDPSEAAYAMCNYCGSSREWAEKVIEKATSGKPSEAAYLMHRDHGSSREWVEKVQKNNKTDSKG